MIFKLKTLALAAALCVSLAPSAFGQSFPGVIPNNTILGNDSGAAGQVDALTASEVRTVADVYSTSEVDAAVAAATVATLDDVGDVTITSIASGELLQWNGSAWINQTLAEIDLLTVTAATAAYQPLDGDLTAIAALSTTAFGRGLLTETDASTTRTTLDVDQAGTDNSVNVTLTGSLDYLTLSGQEITRNAIDLSTDTTGSLAAASVSIADAGVIITATDVEGALQENRTAIDAIEADYLTSSDIGVTVLAQQTIGIADNNLLEVDAAAGAPADDEYARFTANGLEGRTEAEFKADFNLEIGTDVQAFDADLSTYAGITPSAAGLTVLTYVDPNADAIIGWDDTAGAIESLSVAEVLAVIEATTPLLTEAEAAAAYQPLDSDLTAIAALSTSAAGRSCLTLADDNLDELVMWDDTAGACVSMALADITAEASPASGDFFIMYGAEGDVRKVDFDDMPAGGTSLPADPNIDAFLIWDDSDGAAEWSTLASITTEATPVTGDFIIIIDDGGNLLKVDWSAVGGGGGATTALDNLASVAVNTDIVSDTDSTDSLGSATIAWLHVYVDDIELGHATANTLTASGGVLLIEGIALASTNGETVTFTTDPGADVIFGFDDTADAYEALTAAEAYAVIASEIDAVFLTEAEATAAYQPLDADLTAVAALTTTAAGLTILEYVDPNADAIIIWDDTAGALESGSVAEVLAIIEATTPILTEAEAAAAYQPLDSDLTAIAALSTSAAGRSCLTLADNNLDELVMWDDTAGACVSMALADITAEASPASGDFFIMYGAEGDVRKVDVDNMPGGGGGASTALDNLAAVAINTSLVSDTDSTDDLGSASILWDEVWADDFQFTGDGNNTLNCAGGECTIEGDKLKQAGKETIWVPAGSLIPAETNGCDDPLRVEQTVVNALVMFCQDDDATDVSAWFDVAFPKSWNAGTVTAQLFWSTSDGTGSETLDVTIACGSAVNDGALDSATVGTAIQFSDTSIAAADLHVSSETSAITCANAADDAQTFFRLQLDASGNGTDDVGILGVKLYYTTDLANDD